MALRELWGGETENFPLNNLERWDTYMLIYIYLHTNEVSMYSERYTNKYEDYCFLKHDIVL
jgi:hypothetical protein